MVIKTGGGSANLPFTASSNGFHIESCRHDGEGMLAPYQDHGFTTLIIVIPSKRHSCVWSLLMQRNHNTRKNVCTFKH